MAHTLLPKASSGIPAKRLGMVRRLCCTLFLMGCALPVDAQGFPRDLPGITVTGRATLRAHADVLYLIAHLGPVAGAAADNLDAAADAVAATLTRAQAKDVTAGASMRAGTSIVDRTISATIGDPTIPLLTSLAESITAAAKPYPGIFVEGVTFALGLAQCTAVEGRLQTLAIADARSRAGRLADAAAVTLGPPTVMTPGGLAGYAFPCRPTRMIERAEANADALSADGNVEFGLFVNMTFPITSPR